MSDLGYWLNPINFIKEGIKGYTNTGKPIKGRDNISQAETDFHNFIKGLFGNSVKDNVNFINDSIDRFFGEKIYGSNDPIVTAVTDFIGHAPKYDSGYDYSKYTDTSSSSGSGGGSGGGITTTSVVPVGNSGREEDPYNIFGDYQQYVDATKAISDYNTGLSRAMAEEQNTWQRETNQIAMDFNAAEAAKNRDWQEYMSNTAHQREVQDLMAAGLNPILSASGGNGAAVTSGATASGVTSAGTKGDIDLTFANSLMHFLNNVMGYATSTASAGISAGGVLGAARIAADNPNTVYGLVRRLIDQSGANSGLTSLIRGLLNR